MTEQDFARSKCLFEENGYFIGEHVFEKQQFGSWYIDVSRPDLPPQRVIWDGRDKWLIVQTFGSSGFWMDKWIGRTREEQNPEHALEHLATPVTREWEQEVERANKEYSDRLQFEQALRLANQCWGADCFTDFVEQLEPFRDRLSPAQLKRLDIAKKRAADAR